MIGKRGVPRRSMTLLCSPHSGASYDGDAAIDDLRIFDNPCVILPANANPDDIVPTTATTAGTTIAPAGPYDCTFENGICNGWQNMANNIFNWTLVQASTVPAPRKLSLSARA